MKVSKDLTYNIDFLSNVQYANKHDFYYFWAVGPRKSSFNFNHSKETNFVLSYNLTSSFLITVTVWVNFRLYVHVYSTVRDYVHRARHISLQRQ